MAALASANAARVRMRFKCASLSDAKTGENPVQGLFGGGAVTYMPERGESDSGVFLFRSEALRQALPRLLGSGECIGRQTGELNFLPIFPMFDSEPGQLITAPIMTEEESVGVNSPADAAYLEQQLLARGNERA